MPGTEAVHIHIHLDSSDQTEVLERLANMEAIMSDTQAALTGLTDQIAATNARVVEDVAHLQQLLDQALATDVADAETIAALQADSAATVARINEATNSLAAIDPLTDFPATPDPEPPVEQPGV